MQCKLVFFVFIQLFILNLQSTFPLFSSAQNLSSPAKPKSINSSVNTKATNTTSRNSSSNIDPNTLSEYKSIINAIHGRIQDELLSPQIHSKLFKDSNSIASCCRQNYTDFTFHAPTFWNDLKAAQSKRKEKRALIVAIDAGFYSTSNIGTSSSLQKLDEIQYGEFRLARLSSSPSSLFRLLNDSSVRNRKGFDVSEQLVLVTSGYGCNGSPFRGISCKIPEIETDAAHELLNHPMIRAWWINNHDSNFHHHKLMYLPLGAFQHCCLVSNKMQTLNALHHIYGVNISNRVLNSSSKWPPVFMSVSFGDDPGLYKYEHRAKVVKRVSSRFSGVKNQWGLSQFQYYEQMRHHAFTVSPKGLVSDCYRHYQALLSGSIPIIDRHHSLTNIFSGLPVVEISPPSNKTKNEGVRIEWKSLNPSVLVSEAKRLLHRKNTFAWHKLTHKFWFDEVRRSAFPRKSEGKQKVPDSKLNKVKRKSL